MKQSDEAKLEFNNMLDLYLLGVRDTQSGYCRHLSRAASTDAKRKPEALEACVGEATAAFAFKATAAAKIRRVEQYCERHPAYKVLAAFNAVSIFGTENDDLWNEVK